jgi:chromosome segregation ATPase
VIDIKNQTSDRHEEVVRLQNQLNELRSQIEVAREEDRRLADRVIQAKELLKFAQRRNERLKNH